MQKRYILNLLSVVRLCFVPLFAYIFFLDYPQHVAAAILIFFLAGATDVLDGWIARRNGWVSNLGKVLDPLADKLLVVAALLCIYVGKRQPAYLVLFLLSAGKELLMIVGSAWMLKRRVVVYADWFGKIATGLFAAGVILALLSFQDSRLIPYDFYTLLIATALSYAALVHYGIRAFFPGLKTGKDDRKTQEKQA